MTTANLDIVSISVEHKRRRENAQGKRSEGPIALAPFTTLV